MRFIEFHWDSLSYIEFHGVSLSFLEFLRVSLSFTEFLWVSLSFFEFLRVSFSFIEFLWVSFNFFEFHWVSLSFIEFHWVSLSYWVSLSFFEFHWVSLSFSEILSLGSWIFVIQYWYLPWRTDIITCSEIWGGLRSVVIIRPFFFMQSIIYIWFLVFIAWGYLMTVVLLVFLYWVFFQCSWHFYVFVHVHCSVHVIGF